MRIVSVFLAGVSLLAASSALAGDEVLYAGEADWVDVYKASDIDTEGKTPLALYDIQQRIEGGTLSVYVDQALKLDTPQALTQAGTSTAAWQPDKGDLTIHRVEILRGDTRIDVLAGGARYTVLRRETQLEQRMLDGRLTATLAVPGLQLGDVLRISYTQTNHDPTLKGEVQMTNALIAAPTEVGYAREIVSWPRAENVRWKAGPREVDVKEEDVGGDHRLLVAMPLAKPEDMPADAPWRFRRGSAIQAGTFADWADVSRIFAPLYAPGGTIAQGSALAQEVAKIRSETPDPLRRAMLATRLVQDAISYQMNGMSTGNYVPQTPAETWELRYGDCKAKTLLLLALLDGLGIESEAVLVNSTFSDGVPDFLPMPSAFDHVLVHARIAGTDYWLDGTSTGMRMGNIADTPTFRNGLPLRADGADLMAIAPRVPHTPQARVAITLDERGGVDLPALVQIKASLSGATGAGIGAAVGQMSDEQKKQLIEKFAETVAKGVMISEGAVAFDEASGIATVSIDGIQTSGWKSQGARERHEFADLPSSDVAFDPDRARPAWKDLPVNTGFPTLQETDLTVLLPEDETGYILRGRPELEMDFANVHFVRKAVLGEHRLDVEERIESLGGEVPASAIPAEKGKAARVANSAVFLLSPAGAVRLWEMPKAQYRDRIAPYEAAYARAIAREPDEAESYLARARFRAGLRNLEGAVEDADAAIALDPSPGALRYRGYLRGEQGRFELALEDLKAAFDRDPSAEGALPLALMLGQVGKVADSLALADEYDDYGAGHPAWVQVRAEALGHDGRGAEGLALIDDLIEERPGEGWIFNNSCDYRARYAVGGEDMISMCDKGVEQGGIASAALDSRAMAWLRLGDMEKALADADASLALDPGQISSRYIRAFAQRGLGKEEDAQATLSYVAKFWPKTALEFASHGFKP